MSKLIGRGSTGFVYKPALKCENSKYINYDGKVSKVFLYKQDAEQELNEIDAMLEKYKSIKKYMLGRPILCKPQKDDNYYEALMNERKIRDGKDNWQLVIKDGGSDLLSVRKMLSSYSPLEISLFLTSILNIIEGVAFFQKNDIIHQDIKLDNIVYNKITSQMKFIDFGLATSRTDFIQAATENFDKTRDDAVPYYPKENTCMKQQSFIKDIKCSGYKITYLNYNKFITAVADSFDSFCLARTLYELLCKTPIDLINREFANEVEKILADYRYNIELRKSDVISLFNDYKELLEKYDYYVSPKKSIVSRFSSIFRNTRKTRIEPTNRNTRKNNTHKNADRGGKRKRKKRIQ